MNLHGMMQGIISDMEKSILEKASSGALPGFGGTTAIPQRAFSKDVLNKFTAGMPPSPIYRNVVVRPDIRSCLDRDFQITDPTNAASEIYGIRVFSKTDQEAQAWVINDEGILRGYLDGRITEQTLRVMSMDVRLMETI